MRIDKEKMSKSLNNFLTLNDLCSQFDPMVIRYLFLQHQYRNPLDFSLDELPGIQKSYQRLCMLCKDQTIPDFYKPGIADFSSIGQHMLRFLCDDLNLPGMLGVVFEHFKEIQASSELQLQVRFILNRITGLALEPLPEKVVELTPEIARMIEEREQARKRKEWAVADNLREKLRALGFEMQDEKL